MLPKLKLPLYELTLPSNGKKIKYRPFVVRERANLLLALQEGHMSRILVAIEELFNACTFGVCKLNEMPIVDSEYLFINIRNKSIGEDLDIVHTCVECEKQNDVMLSLENIVVEGVAGNNDIDLGDNIFLKMKYPTLTHSTILGDEPTEESVLKVIASCVDCVVTGQSVHKSEDSTVEEMMEFILGLTQTQLNKVEAFFESIPKIVAHAHYECKHCKAVNDFKIEGLENFFD